MEFWAFAADGIEEGFGLRNEAAAVLLFECDFKNVFGNFDQSEVSLHLKLELGEKVEVEWAGPGADKLALRCPNRKEFVGGRNGRREKG